MIYTFMQYAYTMVDLGLERGCFGWQDGEATKPMAMRWPLGGGGGGGGGIIAMEA